MSEHAATAAGSGTYPVRLGLEAPVEVARWRPLLHWLLAIPQWIVLYVLGMVTGVLTVIAWFAILFTARIPRGLFDFMVMAQRYSWRVMTYGLWMREPYPPFEFTPASEDPGGDPAWLTIEYPERLSRLLIFVKWLLVIPHAIVLYILYIGAFVATVIGWFAVLITGRWPAGLRRFLVGVMRWSVRTNAYVSLLTDRYPPFSLQ